jgi:single-stranded-DNA-specific exonuclease
MKWIKKEAGQTAVRSLAERFDLDLLTASILVRRGITNPAELMYFLEDDPRYLHNPFLFEGMEDAVDRIFLAMDEKEKVLVFGDRDADGVTSTTLLVEAFAGLGIEVSWRLPGQADPYGLSVKAIDEFAGEGGSLIVTVDCGISNHREVEHAAELGIDVIIVDHHLLKAAEPPAALAVINPKLTGTAYPFRDLAGCGVAYKLVSALKLARTGVYKQDIALLNVRPVNEAYLIEAVRLSNLVEIGRVRETIVPGMVDISNTRLLSFLQGRQIFVWDAELQKRLFAKALGTGVELQCFDARSEVAALIPQTAGQSLLRLRELSRIGRYREGALEEIEVFENLFVSFALRRSDWFGEDDLSRLQLVALGTIADIMPLRGENRILVKKGLEALNRKPRAGISELLMKTGLLGKKIGTTEASWQVTPILNAAGRMGSAETAAKLLISGDRGEREALADQILAMNVERRRLGAECWDRVYPLARASFELHGEKFVVVGSAEVNRGITGIIASRVASTFSVPAVVASFMPDGTVVGSMRSARGFPLSAFLEASADLFIDYGGHEAAAGFSLPLASWPDFLSRAASFMESAELASPEETVNVDAELPHEWVKPEITETTERFEPYGEGNPPLVFLSRNVPIMAADIVGKQDKAHLKLTLDFGKNKWPALLWSGAERLNRDFSVGDRIDLVYKVTKNRWNGQDQSQLEVIDARRGEEGPAT